MGVGVSLDLPGIGSTSGGKWGLVRVHDRKMKTRADARSGSEIKAPSTQNLLIIRIVAHARASGAIALVLFSLQQIINERRTGLFGKTNQLIKIENNSK